MRCTYCHTEIHQGDRFCSNCGKETAQDVRPESDNDRCPVCGTVNDPQVQYCASCGALLPHRSRSSSVPQQEPRKEHTPSASQSIVRFLQSWKLTLGLAAVFVVVLVIIGTSRNQETHVHNATGDFSAHAQQIMEEIGQLQKRVEENPDDTGAMLRLANRLHDVRMFARAITVYEEYLKRKPDDTDARVDLGICFFEVGLADEAKREEYFTKAREEMQKALTYNPKHQLAHFNLGIVYLRSGDMRESNSWFKKCYELDPNSETGKRALELYTQHQSLIQ